MLRLGDRSACAGHWACHLPRPAGRALRSAANAPLVTVPQPPCGRWRCPCCGRSVTLATNQLPIPTSRQPYRRERLARGNSFLRFVDRVCCEIARCGLALAFCGEFVVASVRTSCAPLLLPRTSRNKSEYAILAGSKIDGQVEKTCPAHEAQNLGIWLEPGDSFKVRTAVFERVQKTSPAL